VSKKKMGFSGEGVVCRRWRKLWDRGLSNLGARGEVREKTKRDYLSCERRDWGGGRGKGK